MQFSITTSEFVISNPTFVVCDPPAVIAAWLAPSTQKPLIYTFPAQSFTETLLREFAYTNPTVLDLSAIRFISLLCCTAPLLVIAISELAELSS